MQHDRCEILGRSAIQHGPFSNRVYLMKLDRRDMPEIVEGLEGLAKKEGYTKIVAKIPQSAASVFLAHGYLQEGIVSLFYRGVEDALFLCKYLDEARAKPVNPEALKRILSLAQEKAQSAREKVVPVPEGMTLIRCTAEDAEAMSQVYQEVFPTYPFPIHDPEYLRETMASHVDYFGIIEGEKFIALASAEQDITGSNVEMTDFAALPAHRGQGLARILLQAMEAAMIRSGIHTAHTIARAESPGMNITFAQMGYKWSGTLLNNTQISGKIESMNIWYKSLLPAI